MITLLRVNAFIAWILLTNAARFFSGRDADLAFKCEIGAMANYQIFLDPGIIPEDMLKKLKVRVRIQAAVLIWLLVIMPLWFAIR